MWQSECGKYAQGEEGGQLSGHLVGTGMPQTHFGLLINEPVQLIEHVLHMQGHEQTSFIRNQTEYDGVRLKNFHWGTR